MASPMDVKRSPAALFVGVHLRDIAQQASIDVAEIASVVGVSDIDGPLDPAVVVRLQRFLDERGRGTAVTSTGSALHP